MVKLGNLKEQLINSKRLTSKNDLTRFSDKSSVNHTHTNTDEESIYITVQQLEDSLRRGLPSNFLSLKDELKSSIEEYTGGSIVKGAAFSSFHKYISEDIDFNTILSELKTKYSNELTELGIIDLPTGVDNFLSILAESHCLRRAIEEKTGKDLTNTPLSEYASVLSNNSKLIVNMPNLMNQYTPLIIHSKITNFDENNNYILKISSELFDTITVTDIVTDEITEQIMIKNYGVKDVVFELIYTKEGTQYTYNYGQELTVNEVKQQELLITKHHTGTIYNNHILYYTVDTPVHTVIDNVNVKVTGEAGKVLTTSTIMNNELKIPINDLVTDKETDTSSINIDIKISIPETGASKSKILNETITYQSYIKRELDNNLLELETNQCGSTESGFLLGDWVPDASTKRPANYQTSYAKLLKGTGHLRTRLASNTKSKTCKTPLSLFLHPTIPNLDGTINIISVVLGYKIGQDYSKSMKGFTLSLWTDNQEVFEEVNNDVWSTETGNSITILEKLTTSLRFSELNNDTLLRLDFNSNLLNKIIMAYVSELYLITYYAPTQQFMK